MLYNYKASGYNFFCQHGHEHCSFFQFLMNMFSFQVRSPFFKLPDMARQNIACRPDVWRCAYVLRQLKIEVTLDFSRRTLYFLYYNKHICTYIL